MSRLRHSACIVATLVASLVGLPDKAAAQGVGAILSGIREGGGWVGVPIVNGRGTYSTVRLPTARMTLRGCLNVWYGHSGKWTIEATDAVSQESLTIDAEPGIGVEFQHTFGMQAKLDFEFRWSEPRDTTLMMWVGVDMDGEGGDPPVCYPY